MPATSNQEQTLLDAIGALRDQIASLSERVLALEGASRGAPSPAPSPAAAPAPPASAQTAATPPNAEALPPQAEVPKPAPVPPKEEIDEELLLVISAAIAAFLGKRPRIRQIRLLHTGAWAQQGRVSIQASHVLQVRHDQ
ncbi:MAG: hypothetical protein JNL98_32380 [Bryobacterales bacterium]|nr:hypothetical protein [Bryobacterales bacterium]